MSICAARFLKERRIEHLLCEDGVHPNTEGQRVITQAFLEFADRFKLSRDGLRRAALATV